MIRNTRRSSNGVASVIAGTLLVTFAAACADDPTGFDPASLALDVVAIANHAPGPCGPGFWKNNVTSAVWGATGYAPDQLIGQVFAGADPYANHVLADALQFGGANGGNGAKEILLRAAVAAILNAAHPDIDYALSVSDLIDEVEAALASGQRKAVLALAKQLDGFNDGSCNLGASEPDVPNQPDLIVSEVVFVDTDAGLRRNVTVKNVGTASVDVQNVIVQGFYSTDMNLDGNDTAAGGRVLSITPLVLAPGASVTVLTGGSRPGESHLYLLQIVDYSDLVAESSEANNMTAVLVPVT